MRRFRRFSRCVASTQTMVGFDIAWVSESRAISARLENGGPGVHIKKATHPATRQWFPASYPARGREPPMLSRMLDFHIDGASIPGVDKAVGSRHSAAVFEP